MSKVKSICCIFVAILGVASAVTTKSEVENPQAVSTDGLTPTLLLPSPSPSTEFSSRLGVRDDKKVKQDSFKSSVSFTEVRKNSSVSASSKSPQISYPDPEEDKSVDTEDGPHSVVLKLLDDKDNNESPTSTKEDNDEIYEGRARFPKIYYGEASPPYTNHGEEQDENSGPRNLPEKVQEEPKYYYPKNYPSKPAGHKKKRFEYKHSEDHRQSQEHHQQGPRHHGSHEISQTPEKLDHQHEPNYHHDGYGYEGHGNHDGNQHGQEHGHDQGNHDHQYGHGFGHDVGHQEHGNEYPDHGHKYRHGHGMDVIGKALKVLIPSAILLTGVSALFPNRLHVPTNDYTSYHHRQKRSIQYNDVSREMYNGPSSQMLEPEHRSLDMENPRLYDLDDFENTARFGDYVPSMFEQIQNNDFNIIPTSNEQTYSARKSPAYGQKLTLYKNSNLPFIRRPSTPQEYDQYNYGPQYSSNNFDSLNIEPTSESVMPTIATPVISNSDSESLSSIPEPSTEPIKKQRRVRVRAGIRKKIKSRPLPTSTKLSTTIQEFQPIPEANNVQTPTRQQIIRKKKLPASRGTKKVEDLVSSFKAIEMPVNRHLTSVEEKKVEHRPVDHKQAEDKQVDLSPDGPVMGLITSYAQHDSDSPACQKRALCELAMKGSQPTTASKFELFLWNLATLVPDQFSKMYELEDIFKAIRTGECRVFECNSPNLDIQ